MLKRLYHCKIVFMRIAIVKLSALGDIVHAMVVLQFIKQFDKEISIDWIVEEDYKDLLQFNPDINRVFTINIKQAKKKKSLLHLLGEFKKVRNLMKYDIVIDMQGLLKSAIISRLIPSKVTLGFDKHSSREMLSSFFYNRTFKYEYDKNVIERNFEIIKFALGYKDEFSNIKNKAPFLISRQVSSFQDLSSNKTNIVIVPGASHKSKCYPVRNLAEITKKIDANFIIIWGDNNEKQLANQIKSLSPSVIVSNKLSLDSLISLISKIDLLIGPDTGPTHMAWALNIPSITLFGPTPGSRNTYISRINKAIESDSFVNPRKIDKNDFSIGNINVNDIIREALKLIAQKK